LPAPTPILRADHLTRRVGDAVLVDEVSMDVQSGDVFAVVGASGSGKTSFLRLLNRLDEPTSGTVFLDGVDYRGIPARDLRRRVGMVTQRAFLFPGSVADNLAYGPRQRGETLSGARVRELLDRVGLPGYESRDVANLSGGEGQRVSLARALANDPMVLLLDEPTSALDEESKSGVEEMIAAIVREAGLTCVMVTHDLAQASRLATHAMVLEHGRAIRAGRAAEVLHA
jgi:putative ABC transport system ATP-binding protein